VEVETGFRNEEDGTDVKKIAFIPWTYIKMIVRLFNDM